MKEGLPRNTKSEPVVKEALMIVKHGERGTVEFVLDLDAAELPHLVGSWDGWHLPGIPDGQAAG
jgi:hypothetical protein